MKNKAEIIAIPSLYVVITTLGYALVITLFVELDNASGEDFVIDEDEKTPTQVGETPCKSPCPPSAEICIQMCA